MTLEQFKKIIERIQEQDKKEEEFNKALSLYSNQSWFRDCGYHNTIFDILRATIDPFDYVNWWLYEKVEKKVYFIEKDENQDLTKIEDLYNFLMEQEKAI